jgi:hypothetical protein
MTTLARTLGLGLLVLAACRRSPPAPAATSSAPNPPAPAAASSPGSSEPAVPTSPVCAAQVELDGLDTRVAVPLLPMMANHQKQNMRDHLLAVQQIVLGASRDDFAGVEQAVGRIGFTPQMGQMCQHMGAGAKGFTEQALAFHHIADSIAEAARRRDRAGVLAALGKTLQACTGCHAAFRQAVVDQATWTRLTSMTAPSGPPPEAAAPDR